MSQKDEDREEQEREIIEKVVKRERKKAYARKNLKRLKNLAG